MTARDNNKKKHLTKFVIYLAWFLFGSIPIVFGGLISALVSPTIGLILLFIGWISIPIALILAIYHLIKWINS